MERDDFYPPPGKTIPASVMKMPAAAMKVPPAPIMGTVRATPTERMGDKGVPQPTKLMHRLRQFELPDSSEESGEGVRGATGRGPVKEGITTGTTVLGTITSKILPGSDVVLDMLGELLGDSVEKIIDQKDKSERTALLIKHYNKILRSRQLNNVDKSALLNLVRQIYNKNLTTQQKAEFLAEYAKIGSRAKDIPKGILSKGSGISGLDPERVIAVKAPADLWTLKEARQYAKINIAKTDPVRSATVGNQHHILFRAKSDPNAKVRTMTVLSPDSRPIHLLVESLLGEGQRKGAYLAKARASRQFKDILKKIDNTESVRVRNELEKEAEKLAEIAGEDYTAKVHTADKTAKYIGTIPETIKGVSSRARIPPLEKEDITQSIIDEYKIQTKEKIAKLQDELKELKKTDGDGVETGGGWRPKPPEQIFAVAINTANITPLEASAWAVNNIGPIIAQQVAGPWLVIQFIDVEHEDERIVNKFVIVGNNVVGMRFVYAVATSSEATEDDGSGIYQTLVNPIRKLQKGSRPLLDGEKHPPVPAYNFCGPGTRMDLPHIANFPPINEVDSVCKQHDIAYEKSKNLRKTNPEEAKRIISEADKTMLKTLQERGLTRNIPYAGIKAKVFAEKSPIGKKAVRALVGEEFVGEGKKYKKYKKDKKDKKKKRSKEQKKDDKKKREKAPKITNSQVQSVVFAKSDWDGQEAIDWLKKHGYKVEKIDKTEDSYRFRQQPPDRFVSFITKNIESDGRKISLIIGFRKDVDVSKIDDSFKIPATERIQSIIFPQKHWIIADAMKWMENRGIKRGSFSLSDGMIKFTQQDPKKFKGLKEKTVNTDCKKIRFMVSK